jgi:phosphatidate cytidylyltransferase
METSLRNRLTWGPIMLAVMFLLLWLDDAIQQWTRNWMESRYAATGFRGGVGGVGIMILLMLILPQAVQEVSSLFTAKHVLPYRIIAALGCSLLMLHAFLTQFPPFRPIAASCLMFIIVFIMLFAALRRAWGRQSHDAIVHIAGTVLATLYLGGLAWFIMAIRVKHSPRTGGFHGTTWVILSMLLMVKSTDIGAYFGGRALGKHKLIPWLSPGKTWEGLFCGLLTAGIIGAICSGNGRWLPHVPWWKGIVFGVIIGSVGQLGDLLESMMKRDADVKDSSSMVPGFGGILDIIDSPLVAAPFAYLLFSLF